MGGVDPVVDVGGDHPNHNDTISDTPGQALAAAAAATAPAAADAVGTNDGQNGEWSDDRYRADFVDDRDRLPIATFRDDLVAAVRDHQVLIVVGDTGCGKTTQLPQYLNTAMPSARIVVTQPRRIAAISAAARVASETGTQLGRLVGYAVRFESARSDDTRILYMTDGALLRTLAGDAVRAAARRPVAATTATASAAVDTDADTDVDVLQSLADVVVLDEAHERSLDTDVLFGLLRRACARRPRLRLVIMSATLDSE
ncbi:DEAH-box ATP-dependent RNA helicase prp22, partial [Cladochytrium tenue]